MSVELPALVSYCNELLEVDGFEDYCPNGLQIDAGKTVISCIVTGVTASQALIDAAAQMKADLLLVHHGFFWKGESPAIVGLKGRRIRSLINEGVNLLAYHLPLDCHPELGNNRCLGDLLGMANGECLDEKGLIWGASLEKPMRPDRLIDLMAQKLEREPLHIPSEKTTIKRIGWCTGAAQGYIEKAAALGCDAFISGEISEQTTHQARELGVHYFSAGHHATERYGVQALGDHLAEKFGVSHAFVDIPNPV